MTQSRALSLLESITGTLISFMVALCIQRLVLPSYGCGRGIDDNIQFGMWFLIASLIVRYVIRRVFNA